MLNPNEAPSGTIAVKSEACRGCVFEEGINECSQKGPKIIPCVSDFRDDKTSVIFKFHQPQPDLLNAATHERGENVYQNICGVCRDLFLGRKYDGICKTCQPKAIEPPPRPQTVTISAELYDAYVALHRCIESYLGNRFEINFQRVIDAHQQVLRAGGGAK